MKNQFFKKAFLLGIALMSFVVVYAQEVITHTVQQGETLAKIAAKYGVREEAILQANPSARTLFFTGLKLTIPAQSANNQQQPAGNVSNNNTNVSNQNNTTTGNATNNNSSGRNTNVSASNTIDRLGGVTRVKNTGSSTSSIPPTMDAFLYYGPDSEMFGASLHRSVTTSLPYVVAGVSVSDNLKFGDDKVQIFGATFDLGLKGTYFFNDSYLLQGRAMPYVSFSYVNVPHLGHDSDFSYGLKFDAQIGKKIMESGGKDVYLLAGYQVSMPEFETEGMFKAGSIMVGLTYVW